MKNERGRLGTDPLAVPFARHASRQGGGKPSCLKIARLSPNTRMFLIF